MGWIQVASLSPVGSSGSATADSGIVGSAGSSSGEGVLTSLLVKFVGQHANTVTKIYEILPDQTERLLLTLTGVNTTGYYTVKTPTHSNAGAVGTDTQMPVVSGQWRVTVASGNQQTNGVVVQAQIVPLH